MCQTLEEFGCAVIGPVCSVNKGRTAIANEQIDMALLDVNIIGGSVTPLAELLCANNCPVIFITGYGSPYSLPPALKHIRRLDKPVDDELLRQTLLEELAQCRAEKDVPGSNQ